MIDPISLTLIIASLALGKASWSLVDQIREYNVIKSKDATSKIRVEFKDNNFVELDLESPEKFSELISELDNHTTSLEKLSAFLSEDDSNSFVSLEKTF
ncbi:hypothetical protein [Pleurocapsa sp. PCC 7319]|uniref:hypothetical protein n=1 Tax=Pleurocapsa sp. PCC 7319 TaxID=118161 RepID=UPI0003468881|nr:hypothetical protein [Pleurocapsa sp. PCC 7319]